MAISFGVAILTNGISVEEEGARFFAQSSNPNQLAVYCFGVMVLAGRFLPLSLGLPVIAGAVYVGALTRSAAFVLGSLTSVVAIAWFASLHRKRGLATIALATSVVAVVGLFLLLASEDLRQKVVGIWIKSDGGEKGARFPLMINGLKAVFSSPKSIVVGNGAGAFSGISAPFEAWEAHNTVVDLATICGIFLPGVIYWNLVRYVIRLISARHYLSAGLTTGFIIMSIFHFIARHFIFWVILCLAVVDADEMKRVPVLSSRRAREG
ncbi:MAG TPA: hypothetical protein VHD62_16850 [Opitutaceae bacterium]|nr:hypothetical protein [Opitutaceae bacterium]